VDASHTLYEGEFEEGRLHGYGRQLNSLLRFELEYEVCRPASLSIAHRDACSSSIEADPRFTCACVRKQGEFKHNVWHGKGNCRYADGCRYDGTWENNLQHGLGTMVYPDARRYEGEWRRGKRHGEGTLHWPCGTKYAGTWIDDLMTGGGCFTLSGTSPTRPWRASVCSLSLSHTHTHTHTRPTHQRMSADGQTEIRTGTVEEALTVIFAQLTPPAPPTSPSRRLPPKQT
jgi:hypothetical protein